jgi:hypothetical protein
MFAAGGSPKGHHRLTMATSAAAPGLAQLGARHRAGDGRGDLLVDKPPDGPEPVPLLVGELLADGEEVRAEGLAEMLANHL